MDELTKFEKEVLAALSPSEWLSMLELRNKIVEARLKRGRRFFVTPLLGSMYSAIWSFENDGVVVNQWREEPPEKLVVRGGKRRLEYQLTSTGRRIRAQQSQSAPSVETGLVPRPA